MKKTGIKNENKNENEKIPIGVIDAVSFSKLMKLINRTIDNIEFEAVNEGIKYKGISSNHAVLIEGLIILDNYDYDLCNGAKFIISLNNLQDFVVTCSQV